MGGSGSSWTGGRPRPRSPWTRAQGSPCSCRYTPLESCKLPYADTQCMAAKERLWAVGPCHCNTPLQENFTTSAGCYAWQAV